jgi:hypothetical protein
MTQQQMSRLLEIPDRTLRDWKRGHREKLYRLLEMLEYDETKAKLDVLGLDDIVVFNPTDYSRNLFWQTSQQSEQKVYAVIFNYLSTINAHDIKILCEKFGKNLVKRVLKDKYQKMHLKGYISTNGMDIPLSGRYDQNEMYKELLRMINDC